MSKSLLIKNIKRRKVTVVVSCPTKQEWDVVCSLSVPSSELESWKNYYDMALCLDVADQSYCTFDYAIEQGFEIVMAKDFIAANTAPKIKQKVILLGEGEISQEEIHKDYLQLEQTHKLLMKMIKERREDDINCMYFTETANGVRVSMKRLVKETHFEGKYRTYHEEHIPEFIQLND